MCRRCVCVSCLCVDVPMGLCDTMCGCLWRCVGVWRVLCVRVGGYVVFVCLSVPVHNTILPCACVCVRICVYVCVGFLPLPTRYIALTPLYSAQHATLIHAIYRYTVCIYLNSYGITGYSLDRADIYI